MNFTAQRTRLRPVFIITLIILLVAGSLALRSRSLPDKKAVALEAVKKSLDAQKEAWNRGDLDGYMDAYAALPDEAVMLSGDTYLRGQDDIFRHFQERCRSRGPQLGNLHFQERCRSRGPQLGNLEFVCSVDALESGVVLVWGDWQIKQDDKKEKGSFSRVYKKLPSGWRIIHENTSM